jgi:hypothetical protein
VDDWFNSSIGSLGCSRNDDDGNDDGFRCTFYAKGVNHLIEPDRSGGRITFSLYDYGNIIYVPDASVPVGRKYEQGVGILAMDSRRGMFIEKDLQNRQTINLVMLGTFIKGDSR